MSDQPSDVSVPHSVRGLSIVPDAWLATIMNRDVHRITGVWEEQEGITTLQELRQLTLRPGFAYAKIATQEVRTSHQLEECGFRIVDTALTLETPRLRHVGTAGPLVRLATSNDAPRDRKSVV